MDTSAEELPVLNVVAVIEHTEDGRILVDGAEPAPGRYRLRFAGASDPSGMVLTVGG